VRRRARIAVATILPVALLVGAATLRQSSLTTFRGVRLLVLDPRAGKTFGTFEPGSD
jgi:hypothetical protein